MFVELFGDPQRGVVATVRLKSTSAQAAVRTVAYKTTVTVRGPAVCSSKTTVTVFGPAVYSHNSARIARSTHSRAQTAQHHQAPATLFRSWSHLISSPCRARATSRDTTITETPNPSNHGSKQYVPLGVPRLHESYATNSYALPFVQGCPRVIGYPKEGRLDVRKMFRIPA